MQFLSTGSHESEREEAGEGEEKEEEEEEEEEDEMTPFIPKRTKRPHPILVLMRALWPFGEDFKQLGLTGKIYEIVKVHTSLYTEFSSHVVVLFSYPFCFCFVYF